MAKSVAFLRGINVGGRRVTNAQLVAAVEQIGFADVSAYQASGNVLFDPGDHQETQALLAEGLARSLGFEVAVFVRTAVEVGELALLQPFSPEELSPTKGKVQVTMLAGAPSPEAAARAEAISSATDRVRVVGAHWLWLPTSGISDSPLDVAAIEQIVGVGTTRTQGTVQRLARKLGVV
ncbi:MAG: DUF1697 domain-containing protein [Myxococcales bacterium]|nr:DUF1697 domain-containing protein [Myxococcales bacterium]